MVLEIFHMLPSASIVVIVVYVDGMISGGSNGGICIVVVSESNIEAQW